MPLGLPVEPEVYSRNSGCSASTQAGSQLVGLALDRVAPPQVALRIHVHGHAGVLEHDDLLDATSQPSSSALSVAALSSTTLPPRQPPSAVITKRAPASSMRSRSDSAEKPPNTTEWMAPMRAQACMATMASGTSGM